MRRLKFSFHIFLLTFLVLGLVMASSAVAQDEAPGTASGTGTSFSTDASGVVFSFDTADSVDALIYSTPEEFMEFTLWGVGDVITTTLTISGLTPNHAYWIYTTGEVEPVVVEASTEGALTIPLDVETAVVRWLQPRHSTLLLTANGLVDASGGSYPGATWDPMTNTATLTQDVDETIRLMTDGVTLDGGGFCLTSDEMYGITMEKSGQTVQNITVHAMRVGVYILQGTVRDSRIEIDANSYIGSGAFSLPKWYPCGRRCPPGGFGQDPPADTAFITGCEVTAPGIAGGGVIIGGFLEDGYTIYHNNFHFTYAPHFNSAADNIWSDPVLGGNYWGALYSGVDADGDGFGDTPFSVGDAHNVDYLPLVDPIPLGLPNCGETPPPATTVALSGSVSSDCDGALAGVGVSLTLASGEVLQTSTDSFGNYNFEADAGSGPGTVAIAIPGGYEAASSSSSVALDADATVDFSLSCIYVDVAGSVLSDCNGPALVTVDLAYGSTFLTSSTDADGNYLFEHLRWTEESAEISIVVPLGMVALSPEFGQAAVSLTDDVVLPFSLECLATTGEVRSMGYWKHQARVHLYGKGSAQESYEDMATNYPAAIFSHFYENELNSIQVPGVSCMVSGGSSVPIDLAQIDQSLNVNHGGTLLDRAKQQFLAALLNVASGKLQTWTVVSEDGFTASQALQDVADRINDGDTTNDELAKDIAEALNLGQTVAAGAIRDQWSNISYKGAPIPSAQTYELEQNSPNPFNPQTTIRFSLPKAMSYELTIYNAAGRVVDRIDANGQAGNNAVIWNGKGGSVASGIYLYRLQAGSFVQTRRMVLVK
jgi:hypothetical protein